jgi:hypothetical protein
MIRHPDENILVTTYKHHIAQNVYFYGMIIYNDTIIVEPSAEQEWLEYMKQEHIPAIMATGCFSSYRILNVIDSPNEGITYCIQYNANDIQKFNDYYNEHLYRFQEIHQERFAERFVMFNTLMKTVE